MDVTVVDGTEALALWQLGLPALASSANPSGSGPGAPRTATNAEARPLADWTEGLINAHRSVFGSSVDTDWVQWKYGQGGGVGAGLWAGSELAAFCGGVPRTLWWAGRPVRGLQVTDVMVRPDWRQVGRGGGAFARVSAALYERALGTTTWGGDLRWRGAAPFEVGYGFPSHRHLRLAERLGLLHDGGPIRAVAWNESSGAVADVIRQRHARGRDAFELVPLDAAGVPVATQGAWAQMRGALGTEVVGERTWPVMHWRHVARPAAMGEGRVQWWGLKRPWQDRPLGVVVLRLQPPGDGAGAIPRTAWWLDWVGPPDRLCVAWAHALQVARQQGCAEMQGWFSEAPWQALEHTAPAGLAEVARLGLPVAGAFSRNERLSHPWWLMAGDTDFL